MMIGAMVTLISHNGGMRGVVNILARYAKSPRSGQFVTWMLGMAIFFDDYANTLVVGNTMRPVTDRLNISREKLSYIVDSTAAPVAAIAFVTTWIGAELSYIQDGISVIGLNESAYDIFLNSLQFSFYPVLALLFILILVQSNRDFGPMLTAERNARKKISVTNHPNVVDESLEKTEGKERWYNAAIPVIVIVIGTIAGLISTGLQNVGCDESIGFLKNLSSVIGQADSYKALLWSSLAGVVVAITLTLSQRLLTLKGSMDSLVKGFKTMLTAVLILVLAWSIALITKYMHTADFVSRILITINMAPYLVPSFTFLLGAFVAFSTGSSWGTMAILYPLVLPSSWLLSQQYGLDYDQSMNIFYNVVSTVLAGSVLGDHCSPISDTTILSSLASSCNHIEHVRTQLPYALTVGVVAVLFGTLPAAYGVPTYILFPLSLLVLYLIVRFFGKKTEEVL
jgi:Na+/H+ antiporter NhaC